MRIKKNNSFLFIAVKVFVIFAVASAAFAAVPEKVMDVLAIAKMMARFSMLFTGFLPLICDRRDRYRNGTA